MSARTAPQRRPTVQDVAREAGVSASTVSRALNGSGYAAPEVRARVKASARRIGYVPDANARSLRSRTSRSVGVLISDLRNPFYADLAAGIESGLRAADHYMILVNDDGRVADEETAIDTFLAMRVSGVILTPVSGKAVNRLRRQGIHVVQVDRTMGRSTDAVVSANETGAHCLTSHLIELGHRRIALLIDETNWTTGARRLEGYRLAHKEARLVVDEDLIVHASFDVAEARIAAAALLDQRRDVTAVFAANNVLAQATLEELQRRGIEVPGQISLAGYDDVPWMSLVKPGLTTVTQHTVEMGKQCAELLLSRLTGKRSGGRSKIVRIDPELRLRGSTGPAPRRRRRATASTRA